MKKIKLLLVFLAVSMICSIFQLGIVANAGSYIFISELEPIETKTIDNGNFGVNSTLVWPDKPIRIGKVDFDYGVSAHPCYDGPAYLIYDIEGKGYKTFYAMFGKDAAAGAQVGEKGIENTKVSAEIYLDDVKVAETGELPYPNTYELKVDVSGAKKLKLVVTDGGDGIYCDTASFANALLSMDSFESFKLPNEISNNTPEPTTEPTPVPTTDPEAAKKDQIYLSDMGWKDAQHYFGASNGVPTRDTNVAEESLYIGGSEYYEKGVCFHAGGNPVSFLEVDIEGLGFKLFFGSLGIAASEICDVTMGSVDFIFYVDGNEVKRVKGIDYETVEDVYINVEGAKTLRIEVTDGGNGISGDWGAIGDALFSKKNEEEYRATPVPTEEPTATEVNNQTSAPATETEEPIGKKETAEPTEKSGCGSAIISGTGILLTLCAVAVVIKKKN